MFPAGHYYLNGDIVRYWSLPETDAYNKRVNDEEIRDLIKSSVEYRLMADVPVGSYLSGGVDSTIVAGLSRQPHTWTIGFPDNNEFEWGRIAAEKFGCDHHEVEIENEEFIGIAKMMIASRGEPLSVPNEVLIYKMTKAVKEFNTVILSGEGADELFFGYDRIFRWAVEGEWDLHELDRRYTYGSHADDEILEDILSPVMGRRTCLDRVASFFQVQHLHGLLRRLDNSTMMCAVEARVPFVDHRLVELMYGVSPGFRMAGGVVKAPLKRIYSDLIPREIIERPKVGFPVPVDRIFPGPGTGMDKWLRFNVEALWGMSWDDVQAMTARA
jgi:asparagine synthase (glutamine-hydrolysing)